MSGENSAEKTILVMSASPKDLRHLNLDKEVSSIEKELQKTPQGNKYNVKSVGALLYSDIQDCILRYKPQIVHFSGHGAGEEGLAFENEMGQSKLVDAEALAGLFQLAQQVECVVLNACYSEFQAKAIAQHIDYVIGMNKRIGDSAAIEFAYGFYNALGHGENFEQAYEWGCNAIQLAGIKEHLTPQLLKKEDFCRKNIDKCPVLTSPPRDARNSNAVSPSLTSTQRAELPSRDKEIIISMYRQQVEEFASDGVISDIESGILNHLKRKLKLSDEKAQAQLKEVLEPLKFYRQQFTKIVAEQGYPLDEKSQAELNKLQKYHKIQEDYISLLKEEIQQQAEKQQAKKQQENENNFSPYKPDLLKASETYPEKYPLDKIDKPIPNDKEEDKEAQYEKNLPQQEKETDKLNFTKGVDYTRLQDLLKAGKWKEADKETLAIMLQIAGKGKKGRLSSSSMKNFPSRDLRAINQLWLEHSNGRFGFSVQKQNWQNVAKNWQTFGESIGWRGKRRWLDYNNLSFDLNAPHGHLPVMWEGKLSEWGLIGSWLDSLLSRPDL